ncbi:MAG: hypothetical protein NTV72_00115 [Candidatus Taylorbacteria bacterium]|nr:hypothetical protein [Candidatus Taylorbacteria bacterium]
MVILFIILIFILSTFIFYFWKEWRLSNDTQIELLYKIIALTDYDVWRKEKLESLLKHYSSVEVNGFGLKYDKKTKNCLVARRYKHRIESNDGWEKEIVWQIRDLKSGLMIEDIFWGTALINSVASDGNKKKSQEQIKKDIVEKTRAELLLRDFNFIYDR